MGTLTPLKMQRKINISSKDMKELRKRKVKETSAKLYKRLLALEMRSYGIKCKEIAQILGVCIDTVSDWTNLFLSGGFEELCNLNYEGRRISKLEKHKKAMKAYVKKNNVSSLSQMQAWLQESHHVQVGESWLSRFCKKNSIFPIKKQG